jgi:hypothetical protein
MYHVYSLLFPASTSTNHMGSRESAWKQEKIDPRQVAQFYYLSRM